MWTGRPNDDGANRPASEPGDRPGALMAEYYSQRATDGGLIICGANALAQRNTGSTDLVQRPVIAG